MRPSIVLGALLVLSIGVNLWQLTRGTEPAPAAPAVDRPPEEVKTVVRTVTSEAACVQCENDLESCRDHSWALAANAIKADVQERTASPRPPRALPAAQRATLCKIAQDQWW